MAPTKDSILQWQGQPLTGSDGSKIGRIGDIYLDDDTGQPEWALVNTGLFGTRSTFVPLAEATEQGGTIRVPYDKSTVEDAPNMAPDGELSQDEEAELYRYYGVRYEESSSDSGLPEGTAGRDQDPTPDGSPGVVGNDISGPETDSAMTRSEEELRVGTAQRDRGRARLRKYVVTEHVSTTVPLQREEVRVEREPITEANVDAAMSGGDITSEEHEVVLHEEEAVTGKRVVPKERVRLDKDVVTEQREVGGEVRKEQIEFEEGPERR